MTKKKTEKKPEKEMTFADFGLEPVVVAVTNLIPYARNCREHTDAQVAEIAASIRAFKFRQPIGIDMRNTIRAGHGRWLAAQKLGMTHVPCVRGDLSDTEWAAYVIADNRLAEKATWNVEMLRLEYQELNLAGFDTKLTGFSEVEINLLGGAPVSCEGTADPAAPSSVKLADRFGVPPFSVLNAREGWWQDRKQAWIALGIRSEIGRGNIDLYSQKRGLEKELGRKLETKEAAEILKERGTIKDETQTSKKRIDKMSQEPESQKARKPESQKAKTFNTAGLIQKKKGLTWNIGTRGY